MSKADALAEIYNWHASAPYYAEAEEAFAGRGDARKSFLAHIGYFRATFESRSFSETAQYFSRVCDEPFVTRDPYLHFKCLIAKGDTDGEIDSAPAEADWRGVRALARSLHNDKWDIRATGEIGFHEYVQGDHTAAKKDTAIALLRSRQTGDWAADIRFASGIGTGLALAGFESAGMPYLDGAIDLAQKHPESGYPYVAVAGKTMALIQKVDYDKAQEYALEQSDHASADNRLVKFTQAQLFLADIAIGRGQREKAIEILTKTLDVAKHNHTRLLRDVYSKLSDLYRQDGKLKVADRFAQAALVACEDNHDMYLVPSVLLTMARIKLALGQEKQASVSLQRATDIIEGMLSRTTDVRARDAMLATMSEVFKTHFALAAQHNDVPLAFAIIEQVRGRFVSELLVNKKELRDGDEPNPKLEDEISALKIQLVKAASAEQRNVLANRLFNSEQARWIQLRNQALRQPRIPSLSSLRSILSPGQVFLEYVLADPVSYCLVISKAEARIVQLADKRSIQASATVLLEDIKNNRDGLAAGRALFRVLLAPLGDLSQYRSVEISPDDILNTIPFEVLRTPSDAYWGFGTTVTYTPSAATHLLLAGKTDREGNRTFWGIGGVPYDSFSRSTAGTESASRGNTTDAYDLSGVHNLPSSEEEIRSAATILDAQPSTLVVGHNATKTAFETANLSQYAVIHFAVHARADIANPALSYLLLNAAPPYKDAFLEPRDIMQRDLHSVLVMLSACDTAIGHLQGEEGVASLDRSFLIAGSSSVISTLWTVDDTYSLFLTKTFYEHLGRGEYAGDSLRAAKMAMLAKFGQNTPPKYWAAFVLTGNGRVKLRSHAASIENAHLREINDVGHHQ